MNIRRGMFVLVAVIGMCCALSTSAYDTYVIHPKLSRAIAEEYGHFHEALSPDQVEWLTQGSIEEDEPAIRVLNHFYDPQSGKPLTVAGAQLGLSSPAWLTASFRQSLIPGRGDCSWPRALSENQQGHEALAFICLGHALHLLEDASVPAHVRNDDHLEGDPYESWLKSNNPPVAAAAAIEAKCNTAQECIRNLALWVNEGFLSKDTISTASYAKPLLIAKLEGSYLMLGSRKLAFYNAKTKQFRLTREIQKAYWEEISPVLVAYGQQLITLFLQEAKKAELKQPETLPRLAEHILEKITLPLKKPFSELKKQADSILKKNTAIVLEPLPKKASSVVQADSSKAQSEAKSQTKAPEGLGNAEIVAQPRIRGSATTPSNNADTVNTPVKQPIETVPVPEPDTFMTTRPASLTKAISADFVLASDISGARFECSSSALIWSPCLSQYHLDHLSDGPHVLFVRARTEGNYDKTPISYTWTVDTIAPLTLLVADINTVSRKATFRFISDSATHFECHIDATAWQECESPQSFENLTPGEHSFFVRATDTAGNTESPPVIRSWTIAAIKPPVPVLTFPSATPYYTNQSQLGLSGSVALGMTLLINGSNNGVSQSNDLWTSNQQLISGVNTFLFQARNIYNELSDPYELTAILDTAAPTASFIQLAVSYASSGFTLQWQGTDNQPGPLTYEIQSQLYGEDWQVLQPRSESTQTVFNGQTFPGLPIKFRVRSFDRAGNKSDWSEAQTSLTVSEIEHLLISQLEVGGANSGNEFIELYNPTPRTIYLSGYQLQSYLNGVWFNPLATAIFKDASIAAHGYYLIAGPAYGYNTLADLKTTAEFLPASDGVVRLLDSQAVEVDRLGYGQGSGEVLAAPNPLNGAALERKHTALSTGASLRPGPLSNGYDSNNNRFDFVLQTDPRPRASNNQATDMIAPSEGLAALWHFDECEGSTALESVSGQSIVPISPAVWTVGKFGCGMRQDWNDPLLRWQLPKPVGPELTLAFFARDVAPWSLGELWFTDAAGLIPAGIMPRPVDTQIRDNGFSISLTGLPDNRDWHHIAVVYSSNYLAWYVDGVLTRKLIGDYRQDVPLLGLYIDQNSVLWQLDELSIWSRPLSAEEIQKAATEELAPRQLRPAQSAAELIHYWNFDDPTTSLDSVGGVAINNSYRTPGHHGLALYNEWRDNKTVTVNLPNIQSKDMSLSFWRHGLGSYNGDVRLVNSTTQSSFGAGGGGIYESVYYHNGARIGLGFSLPDSNWHHIAVVYDSYAYEMRYYIDGVERARRSNIWQHLPLNQLVITEEQDASATDDIKIYQGTLTAAEIMALAIQ